MLRQVLQELEKARGPMSLDELGRKLGIEKAVLKDMIEFWVRKGRLQDDGQALAAATASCANNACGASRGCPFVMKRPRTYSLSVKEEHN